MVIGRAFTLLVCGCLAGVLIAGIAFPILALSGLAAKTGAEAREALPADLFNVPPREASEVYAADGTTLISRFFDDDRRDITLDEMGEPIRKAILAAEDHSFYTHSGVDARGVLRSLVANRARKSTGSKQGGSTLTMQYIRMLITYAATDPAAIVAATEETTRRKVREVRLARELEHRMSKDQILAGYLNLAPFGNGTYGVFTASQLYFGKRPLDLTIAEAATLAAIVKAPSFYDPFTPAGAQNLKDRRDWVLGQMVETRAITREQAEAARAVPITVNRQHPPDDCGRVEPNHWGFFCDYFLRWWMEQDAFGVTPYARERRLREGGYRIVTTLDPAVQNAARGRVEKHLKTGHRNALMVAAIEPGSGRVRALATNRVFKLDDPAAPNPMSSNPDRAARGIRGTYPNTTNPLLTGGGDINGYQGGSTFKVFTLAAAVEQGLPLDTTIKAENVYRSGYRGASGAAACQGTDRYCPRNASPSMAGVHNGWSAFGASVNTYFVPLEERVGAAKVVDMARRFGIRFRAEGDRQRADDRRQADAWGAFTLGVSATTPLDLANAYATLAADGTYCEPTPLLEIRDKAGKPVPGAEPRCRRAVTADVARAVIDAARCPVGDRSAFGECRGATERDARRVVGHPVAGKTGTTDSHRAASLVVTTRSLTVAGMLADPDWAETTADMSHDVVNPAVYETLADAMKGRPQQDFPKPSNRIAYGDQRAVPSVTCQPVDRATATLRAAGFKVEVDTSPVGSTCQPGTVARTEPDGRTVAGGVVIIRISNGRGT